MAEIPFYPGVRSEPLPTSLLRAFRNEDFLAEVETVDEVQLKHRWPVRNQIESVRCCVSAALAVCCEAILERDSTPEQLSELYHYYVARKLIGVDSRQNWSLTLMQGLRAIAHCGFAPFEQHPFEIGASNATKRPSRAACQAAREWGIRQVDPRRGVLDVITVENARRVREICLLLRSQHPVVLTFITSTAYYSLAKSANDVLQRPSDRRGLHAVAVLGYVRRRNGRGWLWIKDSYGEKMGNAGIWRLPFSLANSDMVRDVVALSTLTTLPQTMESCR